jgi:hypothetical protein
MSAAEAPKSEQIQANVAAALSRLRGELGASSSPIAGTAQKAVPKSQTEPVDQNQGASHFGPNLGPLPAGPVRVAEPERTGNVIRPFEPTLAAAPAATPAPMPSATPTPNLGPTPSAAPAPEAIAEPVAKEPAPHPLPGLFARREPTLGATPADKASAPLTIDADPQPDLLAGVEVPPAPPPPLAALESEDEVTGRGRRMRNRLLVLLVLIVLVGGGAWAFLNSERASGPVPVITADTSPEKVKPADEGGMQVPNQNVQILDTMNGQANDQGAEKVLPAPEQPVAPPAANDAATAEAPAAAPSPAPANDNAPVVTDQPVPTVPAPPVPSASTSAPAVPDVTQNQSQESQPQAAQPQPPAVDTSKSAETQQAAPEPSTPAAPAAPAKTAEAPKPAEPAAPAAPAAATPSPTKTQTAAAPAAAPTVQPAVGGSARIQLAAVKSEASAKEQWAKFQKAHPDLLGVLTLSIQKVTVNGADYYRIQAGPLSDKTAAKDLCSKLKAQKQDCLVAK